MPATTVVVVPVSGDVDPAMAAYLSRAIREGREYPNPLFVFSMDTFGGRVDAAFQIVDTLLNAPGDAPTVAFVKTKAISAGALIALASQKLVMRSGTTIGDAAPIAMTGEGPEMLGEKFQSPLRAKFRALAKRNGYPPALAEAMVTESMTVYELVLGDTTLYVDSTEFADMSEGQKRRIVNRRVVVGSGELLTMDDAEALRLGFSSMTVESIEEMLDSMGVADYRRVTVSSNWSEQFVKFIGAIAPILLMVGFAALYTELKTPGFGIPGLIGILCLGLVFGGQYLVGLADYTELLLIAIGVLLLAMELFVIPGFGVSGIFGIAFLVAGMVLSFQDFVIPQPQFPWQRELFIRNLFMVLGSFLGSLVLILLFFRYGFVHLSRIVSGPYLSATMAQATIAPETGEAPVAIGDTGVTLKPLRPAGSARFGDVAVDVITDGEFCDAGEEVVVIKIQGNSVVVKRSRQA
jgi:membrane-bound serine protease (ClpP class)